MPEAKIIDGKTFAAGLVDRVAAFAATLKQTHHITPGLAVVLVGDDPASRIYVKKKEETCLRAGMRSIKFEHSAKMSEKELLTLVEGLNDDPQVHGILVQLPLPGHIDPQKVIETIAPAKDVDGFHPFNVGRLVTGGTGLVPCTPLGCLMLLEDTLGDLAGLDALVVGRSNIVGKPMAQLLLQKNCTVTVAHSRSRDLAGLCRRADILVAAVGRAKMIQGDWIKPGATVIDVGMNRLDEPDENGKTLFGDVDFAAARQVAGAITPVPGGVGPMTIAVLLRNTLVAACRQHRVKLEGCDWV